MVCVPILIASPDNDDHRTIPSILAGTVCRFYHSGSLEEARECLRRHRVSVVISAEVFGDGSWKDLRDLLRDGAEPAPIVILSERNDARFWELVLAFGGYDAIRKPIEARELFFAVESACRQWDEKWQKHTEIRAHAAKEVVRIP